MPRLIPSIVIALFLGSCALSVNAQMLPNPYGDPISSENAKKAAAAAIAEAKKINCKMAIAIVDTTGVLVYYEKMDDTQTGSANVSIGKAKSSALYKRSTKSFQDALAAGGVGLRILALEGAVPVEGGLPIIADGKIIGAIGISGGTSEQDGQCAKVATDTIK